LEGVDDFDEPGRQALADGPDDELRHMLVIRLGDATRNRGLRVGVAAKRDGESNRILHVGGIKERHDRFVPLHRFVLFDPGNELTAALVAVIRNQTWPSLLEFVDRQANGFGIEFRVIGMLTGQAT